MLQATAKKSDITYFVGHSLTSIRVGEYNVSLFFGFDKQMDIVSHWELVNDTTNILIDRSMPPRNRDYFYLLRLIGCKLLRFTRSPYQVELVFENNLKLIVY